MSQTRLLWLLAGLSGAIAVVMGALGAHALSGILTEPLAKVYQTAVDYQFWHTLALVLVTHTLVEKSSKGRWAAWLFVAGMVIFSGSLYVLALTGIHYFGMVTPFGGLCFIAAWLLMGWAAANRQKEAENDVN